MTPSFLSLSVINYGIFLDILTLSINVVIPPTSATSKQLNTILDGNLE